MTGVTVIFLPSEKTIRRDFKSADAAKGFLCRLKGVFLGSLDDGTFAIFSGPLDLLPVAKDD